MKPEYLDLYKGLNFFKQFPTFNLDSLFALSDLPYRDSSVGVKMSETITEGHITRQGIYTGPDLNRNYILLITARTPQEFSISHDYETIDFEIRRMNQNYYQEGQTKQLETFTDNGTADPYNAFRFRFRAIKKGEETRRMYRLDEIAIHRPAPDATPDPAHVHLDTKLPVQDDQYYHYRATIDQSADSIEGFELNASKQPHQQAASRPPAPEVTIAPTENPENITIEFSTEMVKMSVTLPQIINQYDMYRAH